jgi:hypothetical protein
VYAPVSVSVPPGPVTTTFTALLAAVELSANVTAGAVAVISVLLFTVNDVALTPPNVTDVAPVRPAPLIVTLVPPVSAPVGVPRLMMSSAADVAGAMVEFVATRVLERVEA